MNFIGGFTNRQVLNSAKKLIARDIIPIIDYAKEGSRNLAEVSMYCENINSLSDMMSTDKVFSNTSLAVKLSSFLPSEDAPSIITKLIVQHTVKTGCGLVMFDAEEPWFKSYEDLVFQTTSKTLSIQLGNQSSPIYFKTFQAYRQDCMRDLEKFIDKYYDNPRVGIKLVRGAYWHKGDSTFYQDKPLTDLSYNMCLNTILTSNTTIPLCVATHNKKSIEIVRSHLGSCDNTAASHIYFATLLGMGDDITEDLKKNGYKVMKYVPYGKPFEMMPYLYRRLVENVSILTHIL